MDGNATEERRPTSHDLTHKNTYFDKLNRMNHLMDCALQEVTSLVLAGQYDETLRLLKDNVNPNDWGASVRRSTLSLSLKTRATARASTHP